MHVRRSRGGIRTEDVTLGNDEDRAKLARALPSQCPVVVMLPRSRYLVKVLEVPTALPGEAASMLALEVEGLLPAEFGKAEISCRRLPPRKESHDRYEVYIARSDLIAEDLSSLAAAGLRVDWVLPSALAWRRIFELGVPADMFVAAPSAEGPLELASPNPDGTISVRTVERDTSGESPMLVRGLVECIRSLLVHRSSQSPVTVGWIGKGCPTSGSHDRVTVKDLTGVLSEAGGCDPASCASGPLPALLAVSLLDPDRAATLENGNLLPRTMVLQRRGRLLYKRTGLAAGFALLGIVLCQLALHVMVVRNRSLSSRTAEKTAVIRKEGESVGYRLEQLRAIGTARATRNDFHDILAALYEATPQGITYNSVVLTAEGRLQLRGQARSLALPFLLPERLETQRMFQHVLLRDAGQVKRRGGTMTEFRIDCSLNRSDGR